MRTSFASLSSDTSTLFHAVEDGCGSGVVRRKTETLESLSKEHRGAGINLLRNRKRNFLSKTTMSKVVERQ